MKAAAAASNDAPEPSEDASSTVYFHVLVSRIDSSTPPVLYFPYPPSLQLKRECPAGYEVRQVDAASACVRIQLTATKRYMYNAIANVLKAANVHKAVAKTATASSANAKWNLFWGQHVSATEFTSLLPCQRVNHFPGSFELGRKDRLCRNLLSMRKKHAAAYSNGVIPETYLTANEYDKQQFLTQFHAQPHVLWILKPPNLSCGRGIKIVSAASSGTLKLTKKKAYVAQKYIAQPFLIHDLKFDLRIYVLVTSFDPLRVYIYDDGLVRFCTEKYSTSPEALESRFGHLTNYSVNKKNTAAFQQNNDDDNEGKEDKDGDVDADTDAAMADARDSTAFRSSKWSLQMLDTYLRGQGKSQQVADLHVALDDLIVKTLLAVESKILAAMPGGSATTTAASPAFELYGFDVLLEGDALKPWLLEVNVFPSLSSSSPLDKRIKTLLVSDMFQLVGVPFEDPQAARAAFERGKQARLHGVVISTQRHASRSTAALSKSSTTASQAATNNGATARKDKAKRRTVDDLLPQQQQQQQQQQRPRTNNNNSSSVILDTPLELTPDELAIVKHMEYEELRRGHFRRIFPTAQSMDRYFALMNTPRFRTVLCMRWVQQTSQRGVRRSQSRSDHLQHRAQSAQVRPSAMPKSSWDESIVL